MKATKTRFNKLTAWVLTFAMIMTFIPGFTIVVSAATTNAYDGTPVTPTKITSSNYAAFGLTDSTYVGYYGIRTAAELYGFANLVNGGSNTINGVLLQDIVVNETVSASGATYSWTPIGNSSYPFLGTFDGNGCTISGIYIDGSNDEVGLFGRLGKTYTTGGKVENLVLSNSYICGSRCVGGIAGRFNGDYAAISKCKVDSTVSIYATHESEPYVGGISGSFLTAAFDVDSTCTVSDCVSFATVKAVNADDYVGAVVGFWRDKDNAAERVVCSNCYYLAGCATDKNGTAQGGTGGYSDTHKWCTAISSVSDAHTCISVEHREVKATCQYPGRSAYSECLICDGVTSGSKTDYAIVDHDYSVATCTTPATCLYCRGTNGGKDASNHASSGTAYQLNGADEKKHDQYHTCCKAIIKTEKHKFSGTTCTVCGYKCTHSEMNADKCTNCGLEGTPYIQPTWNAETQTMDYIRELTPEIPKTFSGNNAELSSGWYIVNGSQSLYSITVTGTVNIILADGANLQTTSITKVLKGNTLNIYAQSIDPSVMGSFSATAQYYESAIGGSLDQNVGTINIYGGIIEANATGKGSGIGREVTGGKGGYLTVHGGIVTASSVNVTSMTVNGGIILSSSTSGTVNQTNGLYFNGANGVICGELYTLPHNWTLPSGKTLTINEGETLVVPAGVTLTVEGSIINNGTIKKYGTIICKSGHSYSGDCDEDCNVCGEKRSGSSAHSWVNATCLAPKHCSVCEITEGNASEHNFVDGICTICGQDENGHFYISTAKQLMDFAEYVNRGNVSANATLMADLDMSGYAWNTICETGLYYSAYGTDLGYAGIFDGNGHVIKNLSVTSSVTMDASCGLFGTVSGTIKNLGIEGFTFVDGGKDIRAGAIAGQLITATGLIENCYVYDATINPGAHVVGGIAGCVYEGTIQNCHVYGSTISGSNNRYGHIVGDTKADSGDRAGTVKNCYSDGTVLYSKNASQYGNVDTASVLTKDATTFASGEVTYLLNGSTSDGMWKQTIGTDTYPKFTGSVVYYDETNGYNNHVHSWKYEQIGTDTIETTCTADNCTAEEGGSVTISSPASTEYTGNAIEAVVTNHLTTGDTVSVVYSAADGSALTEGKPVNVGTYTASITLGEVTANVKYTITGKSLSGANVTVDSDANLGYTGNAITPDVTVGLDGKTLVKDTDYTVSYSDNTNVGEATVTVTGKGNYKDSASTTFNIAKATPEVTAPTAKTNLIYSGQAQELIIAGSTTGGTIQYKVNDGEYGTAIPTATNAGTYTVYYKVDGGNNYNDVAEQSISVAIAKKSIESAVVALDGELAYNGAEQTQNVTVTLDGFIVTFDVTDNKATTVKADGNYTLKVAANGNFEGEKTLEWNIVKADHTIEGDNIPTASRIKRGDKLSTSTITPAELKDADGNVLGTFSWVTPDDEMAETGDFVKQVKFTPTDTNNYNEKTIDVTVNVYRPSSGGSSSSSTTTTTTKNDDGSTTKTTTNKSTGTVTEVTTNTDGSTITVETKKDGTVTTTEKDAEGNTTTTVEKADGTTVTTEKTADGTTTVTTENADGSATEVVTQKDGTKVTTETTADGETTIEIDIPNNKETEVTVPVENAEDVASVVVTDKDGNETEITDFEVTEDGIKISVSGDCTVAFGFAEKKIFDDVHPVNHWATNDIDYTYINGLMKGTSENLFSPDMPLTRAMLVTVLYRLEGEPRVSGITSFADLEPGQYYLDAVCWAQVNGIVNGISDTEFAPNDNITREQIVAIMHRYAKFKGYDVSVGENTNILSYDDFDNISEYAISSMQYACGSGLIKGKTESTLNPLDNATRAEIAAILHRFIEANK